MKTDDQLRNDVLAELRWDPRVRGNEIGVIVKNGAVTLTGIVETYAEKLAAERATQRVDGVRAIAADIEVKLPEQLRTTDEGLAEQIALVLTWNSMLRNTAIQAQVQNGYVTLTGEVDALYQKETAARLVGELHGVAGVLDRVVVRAKHAAIEPHDVQKRIISALHRHATLEASRIAVSVKDGRVTLEGTIDGFHERELIEAAVRATAGVRQVVDNLTVRG